jgi:hypothetical protein
MYSFPFIGLAIGLTGLKMALPGMMAGLKYTGLFHKTILPESDIARSQRHLCGSKFIG